MLLLLLLSCFICVRLCATPQTAAHQAPPFLGFSRQEHWSGLPFPSPMRESEVAQLCLIPSHPMDCSPPGSSVHGIFQARVLEWGAIAFSKPCLRIFLIISLKKKQKPVGCILISFIFFFGTFFQFITSAHNLYSLPSHFWLYSLGFVFLNEFTYWLRVSCYYCFRHSSQILA